MALFPGSPWHPESPAGCSIPSHGYRAPAGTRRAAVALSILYLHINTAFRIHADPELLSQLCLSLPHVLSLPSMAQFAGSAQPPEGSLGLRSLESSLQSLIQTKAQESASLTRSPMPPRLLLFRQRHLGSPVKGLFMLPLHSHLTRHQHAHPSSLATLLPEEPL